MSQDEKYKAKALIDVFAYRSSKAFVSLSIIALQFISKVELLPWVSLITLFVLLFWLCTVWFLLRKTYPAQLSDVKS